MKQPHKYLTIREAACRALAAAMFIAGGAATATALPASHYADSSVLSEGRWVKIKAGATGMHTVTNAQLRNMGFSDPSKVNVYGFGGRMAPDVLSLDTGDDLPLLPCVRTSAGIVFYATDVVTWTPDGSNFKHTQHAFSDNSFYYLSDREIEPEAMPVSSATPVAAGTLTTFRERLLHENDLVSPATTGRILLGEDFRVQTSRTFPFHLPGKALSNVYVRAQMGTRTTGGSSSFLIYSDGAAVNGSGTVVDAISNSDTFLRTAQWSGDISVSGNSLNLRIDYRAGGTLQLAALDYIEVFYTRSLTLPSTGSLSFSLSPSQPSAAAIEGATDATQVWDVTVPHRPVLMESSLTGSTLTFTAPAGYGEYVAFTPGAVTAAVTAVGTIANQNIHALPSPDLVMIAPDAYKSAAERVAEMKRTTEGMIVYVLTPEQIYNEFSSGTPDVGAFRKMLKMWRDRAAESGTPGIEHCMIWGKPYFNYKTASTTFTTVPIWLSPEGYSQATSYSTDHYIGMTDDMTSFQIGSAKVRVAVGRVPVKTAAEADDVADKIIRFATKPDRGIWRNQTAIIADDKDNAVHLDQAESFLSNVARNDGGSSLLYKKIYLDSYQLEFTGTGEAYPGAVKDFQKVLDEGCMHLTYIGHASPKEWGHEGLMTWEGINSMTNTRLPYIYAATCEFGRWDQNELSGAEAMMLRPTSGVIGIITPSRTVYITDNGLLTNSLSKSLYARGDDGKGLSVGQSFIAGMNNMSGQNDNKLRYCIFGDPTLRLNVPERTAVITEINGTDMTAPDAAAPEIPALGKAVVKGYIADLAGQKDSDFNGFLESVLYDAEMPVETNGYGDGGAVRTYNDRRTRLFTGKTLVTGGEFEFTILMPAEVENNYSPALLNLYACADSGEEANGATDRLYVYGFSDEADSDTEGPLISRFTLNNDSFTDGGVTHSSPLVLATLSDPSGINLSDGGIGHRLTLVLDERTIYDDLTSAFTHDITTPGSGTLSYVLPETDPGEHTLRLVAWDNANNSSEATLRFNVALLRKPVIYDVTTDVNPASTSVTFTLTHDRPGTPARCTVEVFDIGGRRVWSGSTSETADSETGVSVGWDLTDVNGTRVPRGIYVYRATVESSEGIQATKSRRLAVTAP